MKISKCAQEKKATLKLVPDRNKCWKNLTNVHGLSMPNKSETCGSRLATGTCHLFSIRNAEIQASLIQLSTQQCVLYEFK